MSLHDRDIIPIRKVEILIVIEGKVPDPLDTNGLGDIKESLAEKHTHFTKILNIFSIVI